MPEPTPWLDVPLYQKAYKLLTDALTYHSMAEIDAATAVSKGTLYRLAREEKVSRESTLTLVVNELQGLLAPPPAPKATPMPDSPAPPQSREALKQQRLLFTLLEDHYVEGEARYEPEWSDERIAEEVSLSVSHVATTRETAFGPIGDPVLRGIEARANALNDRIVDVRDSLTGLVTDALQDLHDGLAALRKEVAALRETR